MKLFITLLFISQVSFAQIKLNKSQLAIPLALFAGACDGVSQTLYGHYSQFQERFPNADQQFWNPAISWKNKYAQGDPAQGEKFIGSTTVFVFTTDAYHLFRTLNKVNLITLGGIEFSEKRKFIQYVIDFALYSIIYSAGFTLTYNVIFK